MVKIRNEIVRNLPKHVLLPKYRNVDKVNPNVTLTTHTRFFLPFLFFNLIMDRFIISSVFGNICLNSCVIIIQGISQRTVQFGNEHYSTTYKSCTNAHN